MGERGSANKLQNANEMLKTETKFQVYQNAMEELLGLIVMSEGLKSRNPAKD